MHIIVNQNINALLASVKLLRKAFYENIGHF